MSEASHGAARITQLSVKEKAALYAAYIPLFTNGGIFIPTAREYRLGDEVYVVLTLLDEPQRYTISGKVAWIAPANSPGTRRQGIGVSFPADEKARLLKARIEEILGPGLASRRFTQTV